MIDYSIDSLRLFYCNFGQSVTLFQTVNKYLQEELQANYFGDSLTFCPTYLGHKFNVSNTLVCD